MKDQGNLGSLFSNVHNLICGRQYTVWTGGTVMGAGRLEAEKPVQR